MHLFADVSGTISNTQWGAIVGVMGSVIATLFFLLQKSNDKRLDDKDKNFDRISQIQTASNTALDSLKDVIKDTFDRRRK